MPDERIYGKIERLEEKIDTRMDKIEDQLGSLDKQLTVYNAELTRHIEGVQLARQENKMLKEYIEKETEKIEAKIAPIQTHVNGVQSFFKLSIKILGLVSAALGIAIALKQLELF